MLINASYCVSCNGNHTDLLFPTSIPTVKYMTVTKLKKESEKTKNSKPVSARVVILQRNYFMFPIIKWWIRSSLSLE
jgi:hypothetical protein